VISPFYLIACLQSRPSISANPRSGGETCIDTRGRFRVQTAGFSPSFRFTIRWMPGGFVARVLPGTLLMRFAHGVHHPEAGAGEPSPARSLWKRSAQSLDSRCKDQAIQTTIDVPSDLDITADRALIRRASNT